MPQSSQPLNPAAALRTLRLLHMAMTGSVLLYGLLAAIMLSVDVIPKGGFVGDFPGLYPLRTALWVMAAGCFVGIRAIRERVLTPEALRSRATPVTQSILTWHVVMFALADGVAVMGLLLFLLRVLIVDFLTLGGLALLTLLWLHPSEEDYHSLVREAGRS